MSNNNNNNRIVVSPSDDAPAEEAAQYPGSTAPTDEARDLAVGDLLAATYIDGSPRFYRVFKVTPRQAKVRRLCVDRDTRLPIYDAIEPHLYTATRFGRCFAYYSNLNGPMWRVEWPTDADRARAYAGNTASAPYELYRKGVFAVHCENHAKVTAVRNAELSMRRGAKRARAE